MELQQKIIETLKVKKTINPKHEIRERINFLKKYLKKTGLKGFVLGISGGQDSTLAGKLAQLAVDELNGEEGAEKYTFYALRLPYGTQIDETDALEAIQFINPSKQFLINIKPAVDVACTQFKLATGVELTDYIKGNMKARERMKVQFDFAGQYGCLVIGTDHAAELVTGFFTKYGDGASDIVPLFGLNKRQGRMLLKELNCPEHLITKDPTADLEDERPGLLDEIALGVTYEEIDDYLEGKNVSDEAKKKIENHFVRSQHKRQFPVTPYDRWWQSF